MFPVQRYVSPELTHFVGRGLPEDEQYSRVVKILKTGWLTHRPHNPDVSGNLEIIVGARISNNEMYNAQVVCFCDIPVHDLDIHVRKYSRFGLAFLKTFLAPKGANPVFYIAKNSAVGVLPGRDDAQRLLAAINRRLAGGPESLVDMIPRSDFFDMMIGEYHDLFGRLDRLIVQHHGDPGVPEDSLRLMDLQRFFGFQVFSFVKFFDDAKSDEDPENFYMEREWRIIGNLKFNLGDVRRVLLPETYARRLRDDVPSYVGQITFVD